MKKIIKSLYLPLIAFAVILALSFGAGAEREDSGISGYDAFSAAESFSAAEKNGSFSMSLADISDPSTEELFFYKEICSFDVASSDYNGRVYVFLEKADGKKKLFLSDQTGKSLLSEKYSFIKQHKLDNLADNAVLDFSFTGNSLVINGITIIDDVTLLTGIVNCVGSDNIPVAEISTGIDGSETVTDITDDAVSFDDPGKEIDLEEEPAVSKSMVIKVVIAFAAVLLVLALCYVVINLICKNKNKNEAVSFKPAKNKKAKKQPVQSGTPATGEKKTKEPVIDSGIRVGRNERISMHGSFPLAQESLAETADIPIKKASLPPEISPQNNTGVVSGPPDPGSEVETDGPSESEILIDDNDGVTSGEPETNAYHSRIFDYYSGKGEWNFDNFCFVSCNNTNNLRMGENPCFSRANPVNIGYVVFDQKYLYLYDRLASGHVLRLYSEYSNLDSFFNITDGRVSVARNNQEIKDIIPATVEYRDGEYKLVKKGTLIVKT